MMVFVKRDTPNGEVVAKSDMNVEIFDEATNLFTCMALKGGDHLVYSRPSAGVPLYFHFLMAAPQSDFIDILLSAQGAL